MKKVCEVTIKQKKFHGTKTRNFNNKEVQVHQVAIKDQDGNWWNGFLTEKHIDQFNSLLENQKVELTLWKSQKGDKTYTNFRFPTEEDRIVTDVRRLKTFYNWFMTKVATKEQRLQFTEYFNQNN